MDTICALSSAPGRAGVAVIRVSGPGAFGICAKLCGTVPDPGQHKLRTLRGCENQTIDQALVLSFTAPSSFTGEDVVEFQTHGARAVIDAVLRELTYLGARPAEAGEFTRRALENDKLSLGEVEGLADLLAAETKAQLDQAHKVLAGQLHELAEALRARLLRGLAHLEAMIDFADEEVPEDLSREALGELDEALSMIATEISGSVVAERLRDGFEVAIVGPPNAGKSTLLNYLAGRDAALVSEVAGTTRDVVEVRMDVRGLPVTFLDTAGLRQSDDVVERMGIDRAMSRAAAADLRVFLLLDSAWTGSIPRKTQDVVVLGKADTQNGDVSGVTGKGVDVLLERIHEVLSEKVALIGSATHFRHREALVQAERALDEARAVLSEDAHRVEVAAYYVRMAVSVLEGLVGRLDVEAVLGEIFSSFCIGK
ncbi:MAG: tRNA uridine-5-carboxymethylaminomethyl(34) synthesis GTPase MnmE [Pseudomonadota bacterium]